MADVKISLSISATENQFQVFRRCIPVARDKYLYSQEIFPECMRKLRHPCNTTPISTPPHPSLSLFSKTHFNFNSSELISAVFHTHMLISHLRPGAAWLSECQDTIWTDKDLPVISRLHLSLFSNKTALCLSLHASLLLISVDCMSFFPSALFVFSCRHQIETMVFNCIPSIRHF